VSIKEMIAKIKETKGNVDLVQLLDAKDREELSNDLKIYLIPAHIIRLSNLCKNKEITAEQALEGLVEMVKDAENIGKPPFSDVSLYEVEK